MSSTPLRVYYGPPDDPAAGVSETEGSQETVTVPLVEMLPLLSDAVRADRMWLRDFEDDEITISMDLYAVVLAYQYYRRPTA